jgi:hypothetical protein
MNKKFLKQLAIIIGVLVVLTGIAFYLYRSLYHQKQTYIEINAISDVLIHAQNSKTLVVFDIDNTLAYPGKELGSDPWVYKIVDNKKAQGIDPDTAIQELLPLYYHVHDFIDLQPVEANTISVLDELRKQSINFIALTSRSLPFIARTHLQLDQAGIFFNPPQALNIEMPIEAMQRPSALSHGIIFCTDNDKGEMLEQVFAQCKLSLPTRIVYVDDKQKYLESVAHFCEQENIEFVGLRYGYLDNFVQQFDMQKAEQQLAAFLEEHPFEATEDSVATCIS